MTDEIISMTADELNEKIRRQRLDYLLASPVFQPVVGTSYPRPMRRRGGGITRVSEHSKKPAQTDKSKRLALARERAILNEQYKLARAEVLRLSAVRFQLSPTKQKLEYDAACADYKQAKTAAAALLNVIRNLKDKF